MDFAVKKYVFDVAGQRLWKECASMNEPRTEFGCGVIHGKIYVFGGVSSKQGRCYLTPSTFCGSEVYDPNEDRWSRIRPMTTLRHGHNVEIVGDEHFVYGGRFFDRDHFDSRKMTGNDDSSDGSSDDEHDRWVHDLVDGWVDENDHTRCAKFLEDYHPLKDEWRVLNPFGRDWNELLFAAGGKLYSISWSSVHCYDVVENSWTHLHSFSFPGTGPTDSFKSDLSSVIVVDDELLVRASWWESSRLTLEGVTSFQSKGFGSENEEIMWQEAPQFKIYYASYASSSNQLIQL